MLLPCFEVGGMSNELVCFRTIIMLQSLNVQETKKSLTINKASSRFMFDKGDPEESIGLKTSFGAS